MEEDKYCATVDCVKYWKPTVEDICEGCGNANRDLPQDPSLPVPRIS